MPNGKGMSNVKGTMADKKVKGKEKKAELILTKK
jgi:hypothetical protein